MKLTNLEAYNMVQMMTEMNETGRLGYAIAKNMRKLSEEITEYSQKRDELIMKYGEQDGDRYRIPPEKAADFLSELSEYDGIEFEYAPHQVSEDDFCAGSLTSAQMYRLDWMVRSN